MTGNSNGMSLNGNIGICCIFCNQRVIQITQNLMGCKLEQDLLFDVFQEVPTRSICFLILLVKKQTNGYEYDTSLLEAISP